MANSKPDYGIDAPGVLRNLGVIGVALLLTARYVPDIVLGPVRIQLTGMFYGTGTILIAEFILMLVYVKLGKFRHRDFMLNMVTWRGDEQVLDVGTGRGLLMIGAAKRLSTGKATGIDIWNAEDLSDNRMENTLHNAELEGVKEKIEVRGEDVRKLAFPDASFDVIVSNLCIHNIYHKEGRATGLREIVRVLKPGGIALISDYKLTSEYAEAFRNEGLQVEEIWGSWVTTFPPLAIVVAKKPA